VADSYRKLLRADVEAAIRGASPDKTRDAEPEEIAEALMERFFLVRRFLSNEAKR
jgi:hypothetical protein